MARRLKDSVSRFLGYDCQSSHSDSIKQLVREKLDENSLLTAKSLCKLLDLRYDKYRDYVAHLRSSWKYDYSNERGSKCSLHGWRGWCYLPSEVEVATLSEMRIRAVDVGWLRSRARNRWLLWKDMLGRLQWFETGRVNVYVRKPANLGKAYQLICNGFSFTGLITDVKILVQVLASVRFKGAHYVFNTEQRLPRLVIDLFAKSNGIIVRVGDTSHPNAVEVVLCYPDWAERNERIFEEISALLRNGFYERDCFNKSDYVT